MTTAEALRRFYSGSSTRDEAQEVVRVLLLASSEPASPGEGTAADDPYEDSFRRVSLACERLSETVAAERRDARVTVDRIVAADVEPLTGEAGERTPQVSGWAVSQLLVDASVSAGFEDPRRAVDLARLAVDAADHAPDSATPIGHDQRSAAWRQLSNALRVATDLRAAAEALDTAERLRDAGTGDLLLLIRHLGVEASLRVDQRRSQAAVRIGRRAVSLARRTGDRHLVGRTLIFLATFLAYTDDLDGALDCLQEGLAKIDPEAEPRLVLVARQNRISYLNEAGRYDEAWAEIPAVRALGAALGKRLDHVRLLWLEGRVAAHRGEIAHAEKCLLAARSGFLEADIGYDAALVSLDLAGLYLQAGRSTDVHRLAEEMLPIFESRDVHREAQAALRIFCDAARAETAGSALVDEVSNYLEQARRQPDLRFRDS